ncbi:MAG TPA: hypothetical protein VFX50_03115 [Gemmatimonadales bacterium]|nr:hypothetical protein [Gemmatimonadales bacterium]
MRATLAGGLLAACVSIAPIAAAQEPVVSMGQPPRLMPYAGASLTLTGLSGSTATGGAAFLGVHKPLMNPMVGGPTLVAEGYVGGAGSPISGTDGGFRAAMALPILFTQLGVDWNLRIDRAQFFMSAIFPPVRGGLFGRGGQLRVDWIPARDQTLQFGVTMPVGQRWAGRTRPKRLEVTIPRAPKGAPAPAALAGEGATILEGVRTYALRVGRWGFPISWTEGKSYADAIARADSIYDDFAAELARGDALSPDGHSAPGDRAVYLRETDRLLGWAAEDATRGAELGDSARAAVLDEVWLPYNRLMGQYKEPDQLYGFGAAARERFARWVAAGSGVAVERQPAVLAAYDAWFAALEEVRVWILTRGRNDSRGTWLPMQLVLRPEQHDTQQEIDAIIARGLGAGFTRGNSAIYLAGVQFQSELHQQILSAEWYHVLWIHDFRGLTPTGYPDLVGYYQAVEGYLAALTARVRAYDRTGTLPTYMIFLDQNYYEANHARLWLSLLEDPLGHDLTLPKPPKKPHVAPDVAEQLVGRADTLQPLVTAWQDSLRAAVAGSARLQAEARARGGEKWLRKLVKVHVSVTQPSDLSFRTTRLLGLPFAGDNLVRDHRKIAFHDVTERDPARGSAMFAGVGVGESYATATWEDRALLVQGPALAALKTSARELLLANGFTPEQVPAPLRAEPFAADYAAQVAALEAAGSTARLMQVHNRVGFAQKDATVLQMLLYDLMPAGSVIYVPDSIWTSFLWTGQLVAAAFRGCHVYIVAPAAANAPSAGSPTLSRTQELYAQTVVLQASLREAIERSGGRLRVGLYTRQSGTADTPTSRREIAETIRKHPRLREEFNLGDAFFDDFVHVADSLEAAGFEPPTLVDDEAPRAPKMHRKTQFFGSRALLDAFARDPRVVARYREDMRTGVRSRPQEPATARVADDPRVAAERPLLEAFERLPPALRDSAPLYMTVGSLNKDWRGAALDGESLAVLAGRWSLIGWIDFLYLAGHTTWLEDVRQLEQLLPPYTDRQRWLGRRMRNII